MRIGVDIRALMEGKSTGVEAYISNLLQTLFALDRKNHYVLFANAHKAVRLPGFAGGNAEVRMFRYPNKFFNLAQKYLGWPKVDRLLGGVDLFFSPHWRTLAISSHVPLVVTFHDLSFEAVPQFFTLRQRLWHRFQNYRGAAARATAIIAVSEHTAADLCELYAVPRKKIEVIYPGVPPFSPAPDENMALPGQYFLAFGTLEPRKNLDGVIAAYEQYYATAKPPLPLVIAGHRGWKSGLHIPVHLGGSVRLLPDVSQEQKARLYRGAYVLLFLSFYEGFGFPMLEAAAAGVPVIASQATSLSEIGSRFAIFVNPFRPSQAASAMHALHADAALYRRRTAAGLRAVREYSWDRSASSVLDLFHRLAQQT